MVKYTVKLSKKALKDLELLQKSGRKSDIQKINIFFSEIEENPRSGTGNPEQLKYYEGEVWSRKINKRPLCLRDFRNRNNNNHCLFFGTLWR